MQTTTPRSDPRLGAVIDAIEANRWAAGVRDAGGVPVVHVPWVQDA